MPGTGLGRVEMGLMATPGPVQQEGTYKTNGLTALITWGGPTEGGRTEGTEHPESLRLVTPRPMAEEQAGCFQGRRWLRDWLPDLTGWPRKSHLPTVSEGAAGPTLGGSCELRRWQLMAPYLEPELAHAASEL